MLDGTVVEFNWQNPHASITLEVVASGASILLPMGVGGMRCGPASTWWSERAPVVAVRATPCSE